MTPAIFQGQVVINQVQIIDDKRRARDCKAESFDLIPSSDLLPSPPPSPPPPQTLPMTPTNLFPLLNVAAPQLASDCDASNRNTSDTTIGSSKTQISEQDVKKITRTLNNNNINSNNGGNGTKRKVKLRRLGSRQNSKTESDSDDDCQVVVLDAVPPRRIKRKTSRAKKGNGNDSLDKCDEPPTPTTEDVVYVLKIKPGHLIEQTEMTIDPCKVMPGNEFTVDVLTDEVNVPPPSSNNNNNIFVKTKRKIFAPAPDTMCGAVIAKDLDTTSSSSASDKLESTPQQSPKIVTNLPPLPQSPSMLRRLADQQKSLSSSSTSNQPKEPSPAIRLMIAKYNQRLSAERRASSPQSSGSCSPVAWRSPVLERRVRTQTEKYMCQVTKSSSAGNVQRDAIKLSIALPAETERKANEGVQKSLSAGIISTGWTATSTTDDPECGTFLACDSLTKIPTQHQRGSVSPFDFDKAAEKVYRKNTEYPIFLPVNVSKSGTYKKCLSIKSKDEQPTPPPSQEQPNTENVPDKATNTLPRIKRKYDQKPPSPKASTSTAIRASLELNIRNPNLSLPKDPNALVDTLTLSDRAQKLRKAKEEFLRTAGNRSACYCQDGEEVWKNRLSQISGGSESSVDERMITKSASVGMINSSGVDAIALQRASLGPSSGGTAAASAANQSAYGSSLPRNTTRPCKSQGTIGKFGFLSIASKLRNVTLRKNSKELPRPSSASAAAAAATSSSGMTAVSALCRQSLMVDVSKADRDRKERERIAAEAEKQKSQSTEKLRKSGSAQAMGFGSLLFRRHERAEKLKKSKSIGQLDAGREH